MTTIRPVAETFADVVRAIERREGGVATDAHRDQALAWCLRRWSWAERRFMTAIRRSTKQRSSDGKRAVWWETTWGEAWRRWGGVVATHPRARAWTAEAHGVSATSATAVQHGVAAEAREALRLDDFSDDADTWEIVELWL